MSLSQVSFLRQFNLRPITPRSDSYMILEDHFMTYLPNYCADLSNKNNNIVTGYENFVIKKSTLRLFPFKDFDFIGKHVVCQKCCQIFASKMSYKAHVGTSICNRNCNGPNIVYQNYKNRNSRRIRKKNKKLIEDLPHDIKKNLLNPEMLNTLQTRNNCYSDIVYKRNKIKEKPRNGLYNSENSIEKKPRGRPKKTIEKPKKRGRPKKFNTSRESGNSSVNHVESNETKSEESCSTSICSADDAYNNNIDLADRLKSSFLIANLLVEESWKLIGSGLADVRKHQNLDKHNDELQHNKEEQIYKHLQHRLHYLEEIKIQLGACSNKFKLDDIPDVSLNTEEVDSLISKFSEKLNECRQSKLKKTDTNSELTADKGKENMHCTNETNSEADCTEGKTYPSYYVENIIDMVEQNIKHNESVLSSVKYIKKKKSRNKLKVNDTPYSIDNYSNKDANKCLLTCEICNINFLSIAEWKMHYSEHDIKKKNKFLCKICGHRFIKYKNYIKHLKAHRLAQKPKINRINKYTKKFICDLCNREYYYLKSYYAHVNTHI